ncbi:hypothetical protein ES708_00396 [subsurface metagenome]
MVILHSSSASSYPDHTSHVIMVDMSPYWNEEVSKASNEYWETHASKERKRILKQNREQLTGEILNSVSPGEAMWMTYVANAPMYWYDPAYDCSWLFEDFDVDPDRMMHCLNEELPRFDFTKGEKINIPVFLAIARHSYVCPYYLWDNYKDKLPNLSYNLFEKSGHFPMFEEQELFDKKLIEWIKNTK